MSLDILKARLKENKPCGVYLFYGNEEYTKDFYIRQLRKKVTSSPMPEFNYIIFDASESEPSDLAEAAFSMPYMWDYKMIEVKNIDISAMTKEDAEGYASVISDLPEYIILLFVFRGFELDESLMKSGKSGSSSKGSRVFIDSVKEHGIILSFCNETGAKLEKWIQRHFNSQGVDLDKSAVHMLISLCGNDMYTLLAEIRKLICSPAKRPIDAEAVLYYCCSNQSFKIYELSDALTHSDMKRVKLIYDNLVHSKADPSMLLGYLSKCYSDMLIIKTSLEDKKSYASIASNLHKAEWLVRRTAASLVKKPSGYIEYACEEIDTADRKLKRYSVNPYLVLEILLIRIGLYGRE